MINFGRRKLLSLCVRNVVFNLLEVVIITSSFSRFAVVIAQRLDGSLVCTRCTVKRMCLNAGFVNKLTIND